MLIYSTLLLIALLLSAPVWGWRMLRQPRYRQGMRQRLGAVPRRVVGFAAARPVVWVHAVSVGETLAAERLVRELERALPEHAVVLSTTTPTGQAVARERFGADRVFLYPVDFAFAVRAYLGALRPVLLVLMESELWPRMLGECERAGVPVAVVNARVSDRSLPRYRALRLLWRPLLAKISLLLAQSDEDAARWRSIGIPADRVRHVGNLKYDIANAPDSPLAQLVRKYLPAAARVFVAGSTHPGEEAPVLQAFVSARASIAAAAEGAAPPAVLLLAPRHPERSDEVSALAMQAGLPVVRLGAWRLHGEPIADGSVLLVDTVGELAALYSLASCAFIGGSLVARGGHNPLEAAQFAVPVATGPHFENFRTMLEGMRAQGGISIVRDGAALAEWVAQHLAPFPNDPLDESGLAAQRFYESQRGATARTVAALLPLMREAQP